MIRYLFLNILEYLDVLDLSSLLSRLSNGLINWYSSPDAINKIEAIIKDVEYPSFSTITPPIVVAMM